MTPTYTDSALQAARAATAAMAAYPDAQATDPVYLGWMRGAPPPADKLVCFGDNTRAKFPQLRWAFANQRRLLPTSPVWRGDGPVAALPRAERSDLDSVSFTPIGADAPMSWSQALQATYTDAVVVLHRGRIVMERYFGVMAHQVPHLAMSVTKSFIGTLAASLVAEGALDENQRIAHYVPELAGSGFGDATLRQVMDMRTGIQYSEDYTDPLSGISFFARSAGLVPRYPGDGGAASITDYLRSVNKAGMNEPTHGEAFAYKTVNTDVLSWVMHRVTGDSATQLIQSRLWQPLGMEYDAYLSVDAWGTEFTGGGLNACLRDLARFGEAMRCDGFFNGRQIVPDVVVADIRRGGERGCCERAGFPVLSGWSYRSMWWLTHNPHGAFTARGIHGQAIYVDPAAEMVIARFGSHPGAGNVYNDPISLPAYHAMALALRG